VTLPAVALRPMTRADLPLLGRWLAEPLVARWWHHESSPEALERDFGASLDGRDATELLLGCTGAGPYGLVQRYPIAAYPEYVEELTGVLPVPPGALSVDYLVGEPDRRGRGLAAAMIDAAVVSGWAVYPSAAHVLVPVALGNTASWRALERAGFRRVAAGELEPDNPADPRDHVVYLRER
jgi:aminoglycoside 6'-N-acetyltransferase